MNKISKIIVILLVMFCFSGSVKAECYEKCKLMSTGKSCEYVSECEKGISTTCKKVESSFCNQYDNYNPKGSKSCGFSLITNIPSIVPTIISIFYKIIQVAVPVVLVIFGSLDLFKGIIASKEDEIKKGQQIFIKRLISAVIIFFVFSIVKLVISAVADNEGKEYRIMKCVECFIEDKCE